MGHSVHNLLTPSVHNLMTLTVHEVLTLYRAVSGTGVLVVAGTRFLPPVTTFGVDVAVWVS